MAFLFVRTCHSETQQTGPRRAHSQRLPNDSLMIASKDTLEPKSSDYVMPNSQRVYVEGEIHPEVRVPFREISLAPTKDFNGQLEPNEPVRVYDCSGPWGDPINSPATRARAPGRCATNGSAGEGTLPSTTAAKSNRKTTATSRAATKNSPARPSARTASTISKAQSANRSARQRRSSRHATLVCAAGHHHARDGIHRHPRKSRTRKG